MTENGDSPNLVKLDDFEGEVEEHWQEARGGQVLDVNGDEARRAAFAHFGYPDPLDLDGRS